MLVLLHKIRWFLRVLPFLALLFAGQLAAQPLIGNVSPISAAPGSSVVITGSGFHTNPASNVVHFGGVRAPVAAAAANFLVVVVPNGAQYAPVTVVNADTGVGVSTQLFLPSFSPAVGRAPLAADFVPALKAADSSASSIRAFAAGDFNADGQPDLVTARYDPEDSNVYLRLSTAGTLNYGAATAYAMNGYQIGDLAVGDVDGDGLLDIVAVAAASGKFFVLLNTGSNVAPTFAATEVSAADAWEGVALADFDGDGKLDVVLAMGGAKIGLFLNTTVGGTLSFGAVQHFYMAGQAVRLAVGDFNSDGRPDIVVPNMSAGATEITVLRNTSTVGAISFTSTETPTDTTLGKAPYQVIPADIDGNDMLDFVATFGHADSVEAAVLLNTGTPGADNAITFDFHAITDSTLTTAGLAVGDLDGNGKPDIVAVQKDDVDSKIHYSVYRNTTTTAGTVAFDTKVELAANDPFLARHALIADFDADGKADILGVHQDGKLAQFRNVPIVAPTTQATDVQVSAATLTPTTAALSWTRGSGQRVAIFMKEGVTTGEPLPVDFTSYAPNAVFGSGSQIDTTGWYAVGSGSGTSLTVSGLTQGTSYRVMAVEFSNNGVSTAAAYNTNAATGNPLNFMTAVPVSITSLVRASTNPGNAATVTYTATFSDSVTAGPTTANFSLNTTGTITGVSVASVTGTGAARTITVNTGTGSGSITLNLANETGINTGISTTLPYVGETYTIDRQAPTLSPVTLFSSGGSATEATAGDSITLNFTASETITPPTVTMAGQAVTATNTAGDQWQASYAVTGSTSPGDVSFNIVFSDERGNAGTPVTATTNGSSVNVYVYSEPTPPSITDTITGADLTGPLHIAPGGVINGGRLTGHIDNDGTITGTVQLGYGTTIVGGIVSGNISGHPLSPAVFIGVTVPAGTQLTHVIIGAGTKLSPDAVIGAGVRFAARDLIPAGLDLTGALEPFRWSGATTLTVINLGTDVLRFSTATILDALRALPGASDVAQNGDGSLMVGARGMLLPVRVKQAQADAAPGVFPDGNGNFVFVTELGYEILVYPILLDTDQFNVGLETLGLSATYDERARLQVASTVQPVPGAPLLRYYLGRAAAVAIPALPGAVPGVHLRTLQPSGLTVVTHVFADTDGVLMQQEIVPTPVDWPGLQATLLAQPNISEATLDGNGDITALIGERRVRGRMAFLAQSTIADFPTMEATLGWAGDLNGDGTGDYYVFYPRESLLQVLYVYP